MRTRNRRRAGFTLIEIMVAMTLGAIVIASVYTLGGGASRDFHQQQRITQLQLATRLALDRVRRDVERAGLHGTPDSQVERLGATPVRRVFAIRLDDGAGRSVLNEHPAGSVNTTTQADLLSLVGNFSTSDAYLVRSLNAGGNMVYLQTAWQGFRRSFVVPGSSGTDVIDPGLFADVFRAGRMLHIQTTAGNHFFVRVQSATVTGDNATVTFTPAIGVGGVAVVGLGEGALIAPLSEIQYGLMSNAPDLPANPDADITGPNISLVRREIDMADGTVVAGSTRTVLEWAVHFDVDAILDDTPIGNLPDSAQLTFYDDGDAETQVLARPARTRALVVTIGARSSEQDPRFPWVAPAAGDPLVRFRVFEDRTGAAHVRTASAEIGLPNLINRGL